MMDTHDGDRDMDDFLAELERMDRSPWPRRLWYYRRRYLWWPWNTLKELRWKIGGFWQRGRRGWADVDVWYMDIYLAEVLAEMLSYLADHYCGVPWPFYEEDYEGLSWEEYLRTLSKAFADYGAYMDADQAFTDRGGVLYKEHIERMRALFDHYNKLGD